MAGVVDQERRFLKMALERGYITPAQAKEVRKRAAAAPGGKPIPFLLMELGHLSGEVLDQILSDMVEWTERMVDEADRLAKLRQFTRAFRRFDEALEVCPANAKAFWRRAEALIEKRRYQDALADLERLLGITEEPSKVHNRRGVVFSRMGDLPHAIEAHRAAVEADPSNAKAHHDLGLCRQMRKEYEEAIRCYDRALAIEPDRIETLNNRGIAYALLRDFEKAKESWEKALEIDRNRRTILHNLKTLIDKVKGG